MHSAHTGSSEYNRTQNNIFEFPATNIQNACNLWAKWQHSATPNWSCVCSVLLAIALLSAIFRCFFEILCVLLRLLFSHIFFFVGAALAFTCLRCCQVVLAYYAVKLMNATEECVCAILSNAVERD